MKILLISLICLISISALIILLMALYSGRPIKWLFLNALAGVSALIIINLLKKYTGVYIPINAYSLFGATAFSLPAVIGFLILNLIILR